MAGQNHPEHISKRSTTLSGVGRTLWAGECGAGEHKGQPGKGKQQPPMGEDVQVVAERESCDCATYVMKDYTVRMKHRDYLGQ